MYLTAGAVLDTTTEAACEAMVRVHRIMWASKSFHVLQRKQSLYMRDTNVSLSLDSNDD
jgi:hypothetical protein